MSDLIPLKGDDFKIHHFTLNRKLTVKKGEMFKNKKGLYQFEDVGRWIYDCDKCQSQVQMQSKQTTRGERGMNVILAYKFQCV